jgi:hypothetical protein
MPISTVIEKLVSRATLKSSHSSRNQFFNHGRYKILFILLFTFFQCHASICYFIPPQNWHCADPAKLSKEVLVGFIGKGDHAFNPSINLAQEKTEASLDEYIKAIKCSHKNEKNFQIREMGSFKNQIDGDSALIEITKNSPFGEIKLLQAITKKDDYVFILTGAVLKEELLKFKEAFFKSFKSLKIVDNLLKETPSQSINLENKLSDLKQKKISIKEFEKHIEENYAYLGDYWKILILRQAYASLSEK